MIQYARSCELVQIEMHTLQLKNKILHKKFKKVCLDTGVT